MQKTLYTLEICPCFVEGQGLALGRPTRTQREPPSPLPPALRDGRLGFFWFPETAGPVAPSGPLDELSPPPHLTGTLSPCPEAGPCSLSSRSGANYHLPDDLHSHMVRLSSRRCARSNHNPPRYPLLTAPPPLPGLGDRRRAQGAASGVRLSEDERLSVYGAGPTELRAGADFGIADTCGVSASTLAARPPRPSWSLQRRGPSLCARAAGWAMAAASSVDGCYAHLGLCESPTWKRKGF